MMKLIHIHPDDNVAVALSDIRRSESVTADGVTVMSADDIQRGHKIALRDIPEGGKSSNTATRSGTPAAASRRASGCMSTM